MCRAVNVLCSIQDVAFTVYIYCISMESYISKMPSFTLSAITWDCSVAIPGLYVPNSITLSTQHGQPRAQHRRLKPHLLEMGSFCPGLAIDFACHEWCAVFVPQSSRKHPMDQIHSQSHVTFFHKRKGEGGGGGGGDSEKATLFHKGKGSEGFWESHVTLFHKGKGSGGDSGKAMSLCSTKGRGVGGFWESHVTLFHKGKGSGGILGKPCHFVPQREGEWGDSGKAMSLRSTKGRGVGDSGKAMSLCSRKGRGCGGFWERKWS